MHQHLLVTSRRPGALLLLAFCAVFAKANQVTVTVTGTVSVGTDNTGVFGFPKGTNLAGKDFTLTFTFDDTKGAQLSPATCAATGLLDYSGISGSSVQNSSPGTAVLQIGNGSWTFGAPPDVLLSSGATRSVPCGNSVTTSSVDFFVNDAPPNGLISDTVSIYLLTPAGSAPLTTDGNWEDSFSAAVSPADSANPSNSFSVDQYGYLGILLTLVNRASGTLVPSNITVSGLPGGCSSACVALPAVTILNPVCSGTCSLQDGPQITSDLNRLYTGGAPVKGLATDGVTRVVLRAPTLNAGDQVTATLLSGRCTDSSNPSTCAVSTSPTDDGTLFSVGSASDTTTAGRFVGYLAPTDFARTSSGDATKASRSVYVQLKYSSAGVSYGSQIIEITLLRPPVMLVHGFAVNSDQTWSDFTPLITDTSTFSIFPIDYGRKLYAGATGRTPSHPTIGIDIVSTVPMVSLIDIMTQGRQSHLGITFNTPYVAALIENAIATFASGQNAIGEPVACVRADIVAHSMGGLIARYWSTLTTYLTNANYRQGFVHKLITIGTPHFGTPQAILILLPDSSCSRSLGASRGRLSFTFATTSTGGQLAGAVGELEGDGVGSANLSLPIQTILLNGSSIPTATIGGDVGSLISDLDEPFGGGYYANSNLWCGSSDPVASRYTSLRFNTIFDPAISFLNPSGNNQPRANDGAVPLTSAMMDPTIINTGLCAPGQCFEQYAHGLGTAQLFVYLSPPNYLTDSSQVVAEEVETLLNTAVTQTVFKK